MIITQEKYFEELRKIFNGPADGFTSAEAAEKIGCSLCTAQRKIKEMFLKGTIEFAGKRSVTKMNGCPDRVSVYRFVDTVTV